ncbi:MAG: NADH-quinone oxidoreductase subunit J [Anaerolineales bacterium]|nr:NADH-quinone oxidoreductase subunit J [Anaerolineales bacterium]MCB9128744.1 NADH-quinone oxidoreductase subunit J [Ardenticatenales bacterium]
MSALIFWLLSIVAIGAALVLIFGRNTVHGVLAMVVNFAVVAVFYLMLQAPFIAAVQVIVYAGAILVLFLFVVMLMGNDPGPLWEHLAVQRPAAILLVLLLIVALVPMMDVRNLTGVTATLIGPEFSDPASLARLLYSEYILPVEVTALLLLAATVGAVVLGRRGAYRTKREEVLDLDEVV